MAKEEQDHNPHDRIEVIIKGQTMSARPIEFIHDKAGMPYQAIKWETIDPDDGQMIQFSVGEVIMRGGVAYLGEIQENKESIQINRKEIKRREDRIRTQVKAQEKAKEIAIEECPFMDPIEAGIYNV